MSIDRTYKCNLCHKTSKEPLGNSLVGLYWTAYRGWIKKPATEAANHICTECLSSLQKISTDKDEDECHNPCNGKEEENGIIYKNKITKEDCKQIWENKQRHHSQRMRQSVQ